MVNTALSAQHSEAHIANLGMTQFSVRKVVVVGVNGTLGEPVIKHLIAAGYDVTALTTHLEKTQEKYGNKVKIAVADYSSLESLAPSLEGFDALVCLISRVQPEASNLVLDAAIKAGVPHFIPSCFGLDMRIAEVANNPIAREKKMVRDHLIERAQEGNFTFTGIETGVFFDWALRTGILVNCKGDRPTAVYDSGDTIFSTTTTDDIGRAVASALSKPVELKNKFLLINSAALSQNQLLEYVREVRPDLEWPTIKLDTKKLWDQAQAAFERGDKSAVSLRGYFPRNTFGLGLGYFKDNDNASVGIREWSPEQLKQYLNTQIANIRQ